MMDDQMLDIQELRLRVKESRESYPHHWEASRKLMNQESLSTILPALIQSIQEASLVPSLRKCLIEVVKQFGQQKKTRQMHQTLKELTGLPPSKAVRALVVWGVLAVGEKEKGATEDLSAEELENRLRDGRNPYDILLHSQTPSLLDIGAGDLTFERELVNQYIPQLRSHNKMLRLHAFDRLTPGSRVGGVYHKNPDHEEYLKSFPAKELKYQFWGGMDLEQFRRAKGALPRYTMCTCHAPANPTFAYEPSRLESSLILKHLQSTRGHFHPGRFEGEAVLEVSHQEKILTFPPWKFNIIGPLALLQLMGERSRVGVLSAIDDEVFWEILSQILADHQFRPRNKIFTKDTIPEVFCEVYKELSSLSIGERIDLSKIAELRDPIPFRAKPLEKTSKFSKFRYVEIRRGAFWEGIPSSFTAKQFSQMKEESTPWWIIFIPDV
ncbi:MAG: hypothetical protein ACERKU_03880 [Nitrospirota bacterium]